MNYIYSHQLKPKHFSGSLGRRVKESKAFRMLKMLISGLAVFFHFNFQLPPVIFHCL